MNAEFERMKSKVEVAKTVITHQMEVIASKDVEITTLKATIAAQTPVVPAPDVTDADYASISQSLDAVFATVPELAPAYQPSPIGDPVHPALV